MDYVIHYCKRINVSEVIDEGREVYSLFQDAPDNSCMVEPYESRYLEKAKSYKMICEVYLKNVIEISGLE